MIYREDQIGKKVVEKYKDREDHLEYRSCTFIPLSKDKNSQTDLELKDLYYGRGKILNMVQKFGLNHELPAEEQIRETEFNIEKEIVNIFYHYKDGEITAKEKNYERKDLIGNSSAVDEINNKETEENAIQQERK